MTPRNTTAIAGAFMLSFGTFAQSQEIPKWAWWLSQAGIILGPMLMASRALVPEKK